MKIAVGADHGGFDVKEAVKKRLRSRGFEVEDFGCFDKSSTDYPDYARAVSLSVSEGRASQGVLVCTTGIGMSMAANRYPRVRAALCFTPDMAKMARSHNDANVLVLGGGVVPVAEAEKIADAWVATEFSGAERHVRRLEKVEVYPQPAMDTEGLFEIDPDAWLIVSDEIRRQQDTIDLIASENYVSRAVREAQGSVLTNKYAEGYAGRRWYQGCVNMDRAEQLAVDRAMALFGAEHANVQPHCGSSANMAAYFAVLQPGDTILTLTLQHGGHLTHGHNVNFSGRLFRVAHYGVRPDTGMLDYDEIARLALEHKPRIIVAGASAYPRTLDFPRFREIADGVGALLMVDMAHIAGLVAAGVHPSPVPLAQLVTGTTHKTLRGPRGGLILCKADLAAAVDRQIFPGIQGGPEMHTVIAKAVCFHEAMQPAFKAYGAQILRNAKAMAEALLAKGFRLVSGGTDNHLMLMDLRPANVTGKDAAAALERAGIVLNKNVIPFDTQAPLVTSGIRIGTPAATTRGMKEAEMRVIAGLIADVVHHLADESVIAKTRAKVAELTAQYPAP